MAFLRRSRNIAAVLQRREVNPFSWGECRALLSCLPPSYIALGDILDKNRQLLRCHVLLGFDREGEHIISYQCRVHVHATAEGNSYVYCLYWWRFNLRRPLELVASFPLFQGEALLFMLHLVVCQLPGCRDMVVVGCRPAQVNDDCRPCYITIIAHPSGTLHPSGLALEDCYSVHFKCDILPPFPAFIPSLSLKILGTVLLNTGDSLVALQYTAEPPPPPLPPPPSPPPPPPPPLSSFTRCAQQLFAPGEASPELEPARNEITSSPSHLLPVEVYCDGLLLSDVSGSRDQVCGCVGVRQCVLDVEVWLNSVLSTALDEGGCTFHSLIDYDLQLVEVCAHTKQAVFVAMVIIDAAQQASSLFSLKLTASWNIDTGETVVLSLSSLKPMPLTHGLPYSAARWNPTASLSLEIRKAWHVPTSSQHTVRTFSNHTVFTGRSLLTLLHPHYPLVLVLRAT